MDANNDWVVASGATVYLVYATDNPNSPNLYMRRCFDYYPQSIGYYQCVRHLSPVKIVGGVNTWQFIEAANFPFIRIPDPALKPLDPPPPPPPPPPEVPPMVIPPHNPEMVPWTESKMDDFFIYMSNAIGHAVNVGLAILAIILAVYIMIRIENMFESTSSGGGG